VAARVAGATAEEAERLLQLLVEAAETAWPELAIPRDRFLAHVAGHLGEDELTVALERVRGADLYLALGCVLKDERAMALFEARLIEEIDRAIRHLGVRLAAHDDLRQIVRQKILVGEEGQHAKIVSYSGRGELRSWVRVTAVRAILDVLRADHALLRERPVPDQALAAVPATDASPELAYLKRRYQAELSSAIQEASQRLTPRQRNLLRYQLLHGLTVDAIAAVYRVHRVTVARWLAQARSQLTDETKRRLMKRLGAEASDIDSLLRLIQSQLDLSVRQILGSKDEASEEG
jgi:RNA polymerase sigma-70 factor (ECF subfamily)